MHGLNRQAQASLRQFLPDVHNRAINPPYLQGQNSDVFKTSLCRIKGKENWVCGAGVPHREPLLLSQTH